MTDFHVNDEAAGWLSQVLQVAIAIGGIIWMATGGAAMAQFRFHGRQIAALKERCDVCPAVRAMEDTAIRIELDDRINALGARLEHRFDSQDARLDAMQHTILAALAVKVACGEAD